MTDRQWQEAIVERDGACQIGHLIAHDCMVQPISGHHIIGRKYKETRHDMRNGIGLCPKCHQWVHGHPIESKKMIINLLVDNGIIESVEEFEKMEIVARS